jgi:hypothetical protein
MKVYLVTILIKANQRFKILKIFDNNESAQKYCKGFSRLIHKDDPYICEVLEFEVETTKEEKK